MSNLANKLLRAGIQSGSIMVTADVATQFVIEEKRTKQYDPARTLRWCIAGLICHGPYFFVGFSAIDKYFAKAAAKSFGTVAKKTLIAQLVLFPPYLVMLFSLMGILEGMNTKAQLEKKVKERVPEAFTGGCIYWYVAMR